MSKIYPQWWDATLTIYNRYTDSQTDIVTWYRHTVDRCFWKYTGDKVTINQTVLETDNTIARIPEQEDFLERYQWEALPNDQMSDYFTLSPQDIIVKGKVDDEIDEYTKGHRSTDLIDKYKRLQGCMEIEELAINVGGGRNNPHYFVKGI